MIHKWEDLVKREGLWYEMLREEDNFIEKKGKWEGK